MRHIKDFFIKLWAWLTPQAVKNKIQADFMRQMIDPDRPKLASHLTQPLVRRINYGEVGRGLIQVEPLPAAARVIYDPDPSPEE